MSRRPAAVRDLPDAPGVYRFLDRAGTVIYLGRATSLRQRVGSYWGDLSGRAQLRRMIPRVARIQALVCDSVHEACWLERNLLEQSQRDGGLPRYNLTPGGQESGVYVRLDARRAGPGLRAVFSAPESSESPDADVRYFGPYLGGRKVRAAISGLLRVHPLSYAGDRLTAAERDLGRTRRLSADEPPDPTELADRISAVLQRQDIAVDAVRAALHQLRDAAVTGQRYESAGRITEEIEAIDWLVAPQKVTVHAGGDAELRARSGDVELRLTVRAGLLCRWEVNGTAGLAPSGCSVDASSPWQAFLLRNAELAARLDAHPVSAHPVSAHPVRAHPVRARPTRGPAG